MEDLFGTAVNLVARIAAQAEGGEILVANVVRELAAGKGFLFADRPLAWLLVLCKRGGAGMRLVWGFSTSKGASQ